MKIRFEFEFTRSQNASTRSSLERENFKIGLWQGLGQSVAAYLVARFPLDQLVEKLVSFFLMS